MSLKHILIVFKKEMKDIIRDRRTLFTSILLPMILIPGLNMIVGGGAKNFQKDLTQNITIALIADSQTPAIMEWVKKEIICDNPHIRLIDIADPIAAIRQDQVRLVLGFEPDYAVKLQAGKPFAIQLFYDHSKEKSTAAAAVIIAAIQTFNRKRLIQRIKPLGGNADWLDTAIISQKDVADPQKTGNYFLMMILPLMLGILLVSAGGPAANDLIAGEKERNTFEPLLATQPSRTSILLGKYLTVSLFSLVGVFTTISGIFIGYLMNPESLTMGEVTGKLNFFIEPGAIILAVLMAIILGMTFAGIQIILSTYAKSFREAQTYLSLLIIVAMIPGYATMFMQPGEIKGYMFVIPLLNTITVFKMVLGGMVNYGYLFLALGSSLIYVALALGLAAILFNQEKVLFRS
jgi:ABC-type Na+ efflux pump, permease component